MDLNDEQRQVVIKRNRFCLEIANHSSSLLLQLIRDAYEILLWNGQIVEEIFGDVSL